MASTIRFISLAIIVSILVVPTTLNYTAGSSGNYTVTFHETGLPSGTNWSVSQGTSIKYSVNYTISFLEPNGSYNFIMGSVGGYRPLPSNFSVNVAGHGSSFVVIYVPAVYPVTFVESGLPGGTIWNVTLGNETNTTSNASITFHVMNGTYNYSIPEVNGIISSTPNGTIVVSGAPVKVFAGFSFPVTFTFYERGLPKGTRWSIFIDGSYHNSTSSFLSVTLPNGTYSYFVTVPSNYAVSPSQGNVNYINNLILIKATSLFVYEIVIALLVLLAGILLAIYLRVKRRAMKQDARDDDAEKRK